jgi:hypothetical protein
MAPIQKQVLNEGGKGKNLEQKGGSKPKPIVKPPMTVPPLKIKRDK